METEIPADIPASHILNLNIASEEFLKGAAKWGKALALFGFVVMGLVLTTAFIIIVTSLLSEPSSNGIIDVGGAIGLLYLLFTALNFFPLLYLYKFSNNMHLALIQKDEDLIAESFKNLKSLFKFIAILTGTIIGFYALSAVFMAVGWGFSL